MFLELTEKPFIIAEVGQNHQGDLGFAKDYINAFAAAGADAVKFQTRDNKTLFSKEAYDKPYDSENAFASTYGEHRERLELKLEWLPILKKECENSGVHFMSTPFDEPSVSALLAVGVDIIKVASFDLGNMPLINRIGKSGKPVVMSIGGGKINQIRSSVNTLLSHHNDIAILHCVSEYPCEYNRLGLENIKTLKSEFPGCVVGSSDHFNGILSGPVAYMMGARVFEKHVTLNRAWKGTDHSFALEPDGFKKFVRDLRRVPDMLPIKPPNDLGHEPVFRKLGKSISALIDIKKGDRLSLENLSGKIFNSQYVPVRESGDLIGKFAKADIAMGSPIKREDLDG